MIENVLQIVAESTLIGKVSGVGQLFFDARWSVVAFLSHPVHGLAEQQLNLVYNGSYNWRE